MRKMAGDEEDLDYVERAYRDDALYSVGRAMTLWRFVLRMS